MSTRAATLVTLLLLALVGCAAPDLMTSDFASTGVDEPTPAATGGIEDASTGEPDPSGTGYVPAGSSTGTWDDESGSGSSTGGSESSTGDESSTGEDPTACAELCDPTNLSGPPEALEECGCACDYLCVTTGNGMTHSLPVVLACGLTDEPLYIGAYRIECLPALEDGPQTCEQVCTAYADLDACVVEEGPDSSFCDDYFDGLCGC